MLIYKEKFNVYIAKWKWPLRIYCGKNIAIDENSEPCGKLSS